MIESTPRNENHSQLNLYYQEYVLMTVNVNYKSKLVLNMSKLP